MAGDPARGPGDLLQQETILQSVQAEVLKYMPKILTALISKGLSSRAINTAALSASLAITAVTAAFSQQKYDPQADFKRSSTSQMIGQYKYVPLVKKKQVKGFQLLRQGKVVLSRRYVVMSMSFPLSKARLTQNLLDENVLVGDSDSTSSVWPGTTGGGAQVKKNQTNYFLINSSSGGAACCSRTEIFKLTDSGAKPLPALPGENSQYLVGYFGPNSNIYAAGVDEAFKGWNASSADSAMPSVALQLKGGKWYLAPDLMARKVSAEQLANQIKRYKNLMTQAAKEYPEGPGRFSLPSYVWSLMLDLIYAGQAPRAWEVLDQLWPEGLSAIVLKDDNSGDHVVVTKKQWLQLFKKRLQGSRFYHELLEMNNRRL